MQDQAAAPLHYPLGETLPPPATTLEVAPGIHWVRMRLPFALDHINLWLLRDEVDGRQGWTIIDCGIANEETRQNWAQLFDTALGGLPVLRVIVTHMHPDHIGNADWLTSRWSTPEHPCRLWISATDFYTAHMASGRTSEHGGHRAADFFASHGLTDPDAVAKIRARTNYYNSMVPQVPASFHRLQDGMSVSIHGRNWVCLAGFGHAPEHIALYSEDLNVLISGDMVLPRISTNVSVTDAEPESDPLNLFLSSLSRMLALPVDCLVLPSHGKPFVGLHTRIHDLHQHHNERLDDVRRCCEQAPTTAADLLPVLFRRPLDLHQTTFAMGEAVAHLHALWHRGELRRRRGEDGVFRFTLAF